MGVISRGEGDAVQSSVYMCAQSLSCVRLFASLWTIACQAPLSMGKNTGVAYHFLFQGIFLTQGSNLSLMYYR